MGVRKNGKQSRCVFNYAKMKELNGGKQVKDVWAGSLTKPSEKIEGRHPTQKPQYLLERIILSSTNEGDIVLDPFCGSGTTGVVASRNNRVFIGNDSYDRWLYICLVYRWNRMEKCKREFERDM